mgnify:CR=1 FL=1
MVEKLSLTRAQLAEFLPAFQQIKQFENLFGAVNYTVAELEVLLIQAVSAQSTANAALGEISRLADTMAGLVGPRQSVLYPEPPAQPPCAPVVAELSWPAHSRVLSCNDLADVKVEHPASRQVLVSDGGAWRNGFLALTDLSDTNITSPASGQALQFDGSGCIDGPILVTGTYSPTVSSDYNITTITAAQCQYLRVGPMVTVSGMLNITPTAVTDMVAFLCTVPVNSAFVASSDAAGTFATIGVSSDPYAGGIRAKSANTVRGDGIATSTAAADISFTFTYEIM